MICTMSLVRLVDDQYHTEGGARTMGWVAWHSSVSFGPWVKHVKCETAVLVKEIGHLFESLSLTKLMCNLSNQYNNQKFSTEKGFNKVKLSIPFSP